MEQIAIQEYLSYCEEKIMALYRPAGWKNYTSRPELLKSAFSNSLLIPAAWRIPWAVGRGAIVSVQDLLVLLEYWNRGIGTRLIREPLHRYLHAYQITLTTDPTPQTLRFYRSAGFLPAVELGCAGFYIFHQK